MIFILLGVLLGTVGLAWMHELVHRFRLFDISICWKYHKLHHSKNDPEKELKQSTDIMTYSIKRFFIYMNIVKWTIVDWSLFILCCSLPPLFITVGVGLFISCNIEYLQHDYNNYPIDFTNKFDNWIGLNCGKHTEHHGESNVKHEVETEFYLGLFSMYIWLGLCIILYPLLFLVYLKANNPGVYNYNIFQNLANYKAANGINFRKLMYRMPSIFDKPKILVQYVRLIFGLKNETEIPELSHDISQIRNIYNYKTSLTTDGVKWYNGVITEGHHRYMALKGLE